MLRKVCKSPKDSETINLGITADLTCHVSGQIKQLLGNSCNVDVKIFTDSLGTLESIASCHQVERRTMRADIADLKQRLEFKEVDKYCWIQDERMIADILTKEKKEKIGLDDVMKENVLDIAHSEDNCVTYANGEFDISGRKLREKLLPKPKLPKRNVIKTKPVEKEEDKEREHGECE